MDTSKVTHKYCVVLKTSEETFLGFIDLMKENKELRKQFSKLLF